ncbi:MAG: CvpA family protein [Muribaculaceae bacterium]|nr:CvpA family protein [Muribaculaceae bacterium]
MTLNIIYLILVIGVTLWSLAYGFRYGLTSQLSSLLGVAFGAVASRVLTPVFIDDFQWTAHISQADEFKDFTANLFCACAIYIVVYMLFAFTAPLLRKAMSVIEVGIINRLLGACFVMLRNLLLLSIILNVFLCLSLRSGLMSYEKANDGNPVAAVMALTPAILGCFGSEDFAHFLQLKEAKSISFLEHSTTPECYNCTRIKIEQC